MLSLAVAIFATSAFALIIRHTQRLGLNQMAVMAVNYVVAALGGLAVTVGHWHVSAPTLHIGLLGGVIYVTTYLFLIHSMDLKGVAIANAIVRLSVLIPIVMSILVWHERPVFAQAIGGALALVAMPFLSLDRGVGHVALRKRQILLLVGLFVANGCTVLVSKWFQMAQLPQERPMFSAILYGTAAVVAILAWLWESRRVGTRDVIWGFLLGSANLLTLFALLWALAALPATVVFPLMGALGLALTVSFAALVWREVPGKWGWWGIGIAVIAVVLVNLS
jgi:drug/metabolite transporter (DMT)-like permease